MKPTLILAAFLVLSPSARADTTECYSFFADPSTYYGPPAVAVTSGNTLWYYPSFVVYTTYVNNCSESRFVGGGFATSEDPMLADNPFAPERKMDEFYDPSYNVAPGESVTLPFAWYTWSPDAPVGYTATFGIWAEGWGDSQFTAIVTLVPEPSTLVLLATGLVALGGRLRRKLRT